MTSHDVTDEQLGQLARRQNDLFRRVREGTLQIDVVLSGLQKIIENVANALAELIALGHYDWVNPDITSEHFPLESDGTDGGEPVVVHLDRNATTDEVLAELDRRGLKPARIEHLLRYGANHPEEQRQYPIVCLGSSWLHPCGLRHFPSLDEAGGLRELSLLWLDPGNQWYDDCRFLALRK